MHIMESAAGPESNILHRLPDYVPPRSWRTWLIGRPLQTAEASHQAINKVIGLAVFSSDAMSSVAYAPQELMLVLALAGTGALHLAFPLALAIVGLLIILTLSYEQTIHAYPGGGGAYIVARDNLGELPAETAGAALMTDYILTVAVSISSGVAQIVSAFPDLYPYRVPIAVAVVLLITLINLRGVKESGSVFAIPTYFFLLMAFITVGMGLFRYLSGTLPPVTDPPELELSHATQSLSLFLVLRAFASGTTALTGVEAISNGIMAFKEPRSQNAGRTLLAMSVILGTLMTSITFLAWRTGAIPTEFGETVVSQVARTALGSRGPLYLMTIAGTTLILLMAANTAFAGFPSLGALQAADGFLPRQLTYRGSRLVFSRGIIALGLMASLLIILFKASVTHLIPLYAIGVFLSFTLSQGGMARRWWRSGKLSTGEERVERGSILRFDRRWRLKLAINALGAVVTFVVMIIFAVTKFQSGAWIIVVLIPALVFVFSGIHRHYKRLAAQLSLDDFQPRPAAARHRVILPIAGVHQGTLRALRYAQLLSDDLTAVHVSIDAAETEKLKRKWEMWGDGVRLEVLESPYRTLLEPLLAYITEIASVRQGDEMLTIVVPEFVARHWWNNLLHTQTATWLRLALLFKPGIIITDVPYQVE